MGVPAAAQSAIGSVIAAAAVAVIVLSAVEPADVEQIQRSIVKHATSTLARTVFNVEKFAAYQATAHSVRDRLIEEWNVTMQTHTLRDPKRVYYMSLEFLLGRSLDNALLNLQLKNKYGQALNSLGFNLEDLIQEEDDAALGNGGLGRLAACYMDSLACLEYPAWGYGLRYTYGIFKQRIVDGHQTEFPDYWLNFGNPWEVPRLDVVYEVRFYGQCHKYVDADGSVRWKWDGGDKVQAVAYDVPIPGFNNQTCLNIRLWSSKPKKQFDLGLFNEGNYDKSVEEQQRAENITSVLYPNDNHMVGKELRLKQQYFFVCATLKDVIRRFKKTNRPWADFPDQVAVQLNDTHPTLGIVELQRRLVDIEGLEWDEAWKIVTRVFAFTNHTVLPEALETWPVPMMAHLLPRHLAIIYDINLFFLQKVEAMFPNDRDRLRRMSIIEESSPQRVRMAHLAIVGSHCVNGVAALHSELVKNVIFKDFVDFYGADKFTNVTNGITPRRWLNQANPQLATLITATIGDGWTKDLTELAKLKAHADKPDFQKKWMAIKKHNKQRLADLIRKQSGIVVDPESLFDVQVKRIHEYKRQLMNILGVIHRYLALKRMTPAARANEVKRTRLPPAAPRLLATPPAVPAVPTTTNHNCGNDVNGIDLMLDDDAAPAPTVRIDAAAAATEQALTTLAEHVRRAHDEARATVAQLAADHAQHVATLSADLAESRDRERMLQDEVRRMILETQAMSASLRSVESQTALLDEVESLRRQLAESRQAHDCTTKEREDLRQAHDRTTRELDKTRRQRDDAAHLAGKTNSDLASATAEVHQLRATLTQYARKRKLVESIGAELAHRKQKYQVVKHELLTTTEQLRAALAARDRYMHANARLGKAFRVVGDHLGRPAVRALLAGAGLSINSDAPEAPDRAVVSAEPEPAPPAEDGDVEMREAQTNRRPLLPNATRTRGVAPNAERTCGVTRLVLSPSPPLAPTAPPSDLDLDAAGIAFDLDSEGPMHPLGQPARRSDPAMSSQTQDTVGHPPLPKGRPSSPIQIEDKDEDPEVTVVPPDLVRMRSAPAPTPVRPPPGASVLPSPAAPVAPTAAAVADDDSPRPRKRRAVVDLAAGSVVSSAAADPQQFFVVHL
ncbi:glycogen/starch/alpha-glucan phosphorylase [Allomyces macrogynus ATCC 38327]|uniref:Alpha-1,4 glucan phosphorylase n=1 Tax=Allomyces macrogynus (strain ATCC 38327) TaxID=578462 RepID=A0A0L0SW26_ALLM3|nr:glycogen/starch/alpha-glucan phosphorylase [Allomyces macrogynus ATCC 38327]|eukprot:KNE66788.1 glycogen/starch/alpha-glucan phosphorylase [Allomyces macrogynus ATCC 38327]